MAARVKLLRSHAVSIQHFLTLAALKAYQEQTDAHADTRGNTSLGVGCASVASSHRGLGVVRETDVPTSAATQLRRSRTSCCAAWRC